MEGDYEIIFVDDGSLDSTPKIIDSIEAADPKVKAVYHPKNQGYGSTVRSGIRAATKSLVFFTDADNQFDLNELPLIMPLIASSDIVACYRLNRRDGAARAFNSWVGNTIARVLFGLNIRDINCAFKLYRRRVFDQMSLRSTGAVINTEILVRARNLGFKMVQTGVHHFPRLKGNQTGANPKVIMRTCAETIQLYREMKGHSG